jgi:hypothetical protein
MYPELGFLRSKELLFNDFSGGFLFGLSILSDEAIGESTFTKEMAFLVLSDGLIAINTGDFFNHVFFFLEANLFERSRRTFLE